MNLDDDGNYLIQPFVSLGEVPDEIPDDDFVRRMRLVYEAPTELSPFDRIALGQ